MKKLFVYNENWKTQRNFYILRVTWHQSSKCVWISFSGSASFQCHPKITDQCLFKIFEATSDFSVVALRHWTLTSAISISIFPTLRDMQIILMKIPDKNAISMYDQSNGQLGINSLHQPWDHKIIILFTYCNITESGEKFQMIKEIRQKSKSLREAEEKVDTLKKREVQIRETCDAWKKEVFCSIFHCFQGSTDRLTEFFGPWIPDCSIAACSAKYYFEGSSLFCKVGCVFPMSFVSILPMRNSNQMTIGKTHPTFIDSSMNDIN